jgi:hydroxymethylglutaryl-CoA reductase
MCSEEREGRERMARNGGSRIPGFYKLPVDERLQRVAQAMALNPTTTSALSGEAGLTLEVADHMIENVVGTFGLPLGIAANFLINGRDVWVPMVIEEPSVVAGASKIAKLTRASGGITATLTEPEMIAQIQVLDVPDVEDARVALLNHKEDALEEANKADPLIVSLGGGARDLEVRILENTPAGTMLVIHLIFDTRDAMGANTVNTAAEHLTPWVEQLTSGRVHLRILSNLADRRLARAHCRIPVDELTFGEFNGERVRDGIIEAWAFAASDPYRAATHNKGIMNGVDAVVIATGNDWRAIEAGAHAYAAREGNYSSLSRWWVGDRGDLEGELEMPMAVGTVGGAVRVHPAAKACLELMAVKSARELGEIIVSVGLAQNLAALRALATEGIQRGHMSLHARQIALAAGAQGELIDRIASHMVAEKDIRLEIAQRLLQEWTADEE